MVEVVLKGHYTVECAEHGIEVTRKQHGVVDIMARELIAAGVSEDEPLVIKRGDTVCFDVVPVGVWAKRRLLEPDDRGFEVAKFKPFPGRGIFKEAAE